MSLADLVVVREEVPYGDSSFSVGGLSILDITLLFKKHEKEVTAIFTDEVDFGKLIAESPSFVASVICASAGEPGLERTVLGLPAGVQLIALEKLWRLTNMSAEDLGNLISKLTVGMSTLERVLDLVPSMSTSGA